MYLDGSYDAITPHPLIEGAERTFIAGIVNPGHVYAVYVFHDVGCDCHGGSSNTGYRNIKAECLAWMSLNGISWVCAQVYGVTNQVLR